MLLKRSPADKADAAPPVTAAAEWPAKPAGQRGHGPHRGHLAQSVRGRLLAAFSGLAVPYAAGGCYSQGSV